MDERKRERMEPFREELESAGLSYQPFAVSCWGRLHPRAAEMLASLAKARARRHGTSPAAELHHVRARVTTAVMRRAARMVRCCLPLASEAPVEGAGDTDAAPCAAADKRAGDPSVASLLPY